MVNLYNIIYKTRKTSIFILLVFLAYTSKSQVNIVATIGTLSGSYTTLNSCFTAINNGVHGGNITISIVSNTIEPALPIPLNASNTGLSNYNNILIRPVGNVIVNANTTRNTNRSIIEFNGVDNVTIEGDDANTPGTRNLTFSSGFSTIANIAHIKFGSNSTTDGADNNKVQNCIFIGPRNGVAAITSLNYGIVIAGVNTTNLLTPGFLNSNITILNNEFRRFTNAIHVIGTTNFEFSSLKIQNNVIGNSVDADNVTNTGIFISNTCSNSGISNGGFALIEGNDIQVGQNAITGYGADAEAIELGAGTAGTIIRFNNIRNIKNYTTATFGVFGILLSGASEATSVEISNNFIRDIVARRNIAQFNPPPANASYGIRISGNGFTNLKIDNNTIVFNEVPNQGTVLNYSNYGIAFTNGISNLASLQNNIFVNRNIGLNTFAHFLFTQNIPATTLINNNSYWVPSGHVGVLGSSTTILTTLTNWQDAIQREFNSIIENPPFVSATDLHITPNAVSKVKGGGIANGMFFDIDLTARNLTKPDIGADEYIGSALTRANITSVSHTAATNPCIPQSRIVSATVTPGNALDSIMLVYNFDGGANTRVRMTTSGGNIYTANIPIPTPANALVGYRIEGIMSTEDTTFSPFYFYNDNVVSGAYIPIISGDTSACINNTARYFRQIAPDPISFNVPPTINAPTTGADITNFQIGTLNNSSTINSLTGTIGAASGTAGAYSNFSSIRTDTFNIGQSYPISISSSSTNTLYNYFAIYIDFNGNGYFNDIGEMVYNSVTSPTRGGRTETGNIYIKKNTKPGFSRIRVVNSINPIQLNDVIHNQGEVEDYKIYFKPLDYKWTLNNNLITNITDSLDVTFTSFPTNLGVRITDNNNCVRDTNRLRVNLSSGSIVPIISHNGLVSNCLQDEITLSVNHTGGCPPFSYQWFSGTTLLGTSKTIKAILDSAKSFRVTVTDAGNISATVSTATFAVVNPTITQKLDTGRICERGSLLLSVNGAASDSFVWYNSTLSDKFDFINVGKRFTTPNINKTTSYYVRARRQSNEIIGRTTLGTALNFVSINTGIAFNTSRSIIINSCNLFCQATGGRIVVAVIDKAGNVISETDTITVTAPNATTATLIPLNLSVPNAGTEYRLIAKFLSNFTILNSSTIGPYNFTVPSGSMTLTSGYNLGNLITQYMYFHNIRISPNPCYGSLDTLTARVINARVPLITKDIERTELCQGDSLKLSIATDIFGNKFTWNRNDTAIITSTSKSYIVPNTSLKDAAFYSVTISSDSICNRDTLSKKILVSFYPTASIIDTLNYLNLCIGGSDSNMLNHILADTFTWMKNNVVIGAPNKSTINFNNVQLSDNGDYKVKINDKHRCKEITSNTFKLNVVPHPSFTNPLTPLIELCEGAELKIKSTPNNYTQLQWYKNGSPIQFEFADSFTRQRSKLTDTGYYFIEAKSYKGCSTAYSSNTIITVSPKPIANFIPSNKTVCENTKLELQANFSNAKNVKWFKNNLPLNDSNTTLLISNNATLPDSGIYKYILDAYGTCSDISSTDITVKVISKPQLLSNPSLLFTKCEGDSIKFGLNTKNVKQYQWYKNGIALQSQVDSIFLLKFLSIQDTGTYMVKVNSDPSCNEIGSTNFRINITPAVIITSQPKDLSLCEGATDTLKVIAQNGLKFLWKKDNAPLPKDTFNTLIIKKVNASTTGNYTVEISGTAPCALVTTSRIATVKIKVGRTSAYLVPTSVFDAVEQCTDSAGWTYFSPANDEDKVIFAIRKFSNAIKTNADIIVRPNMYQDRVNVKDEFSGSIFSKRFWNLDVDTGTILNPIDVKFYYDNAEVTALRTEALNLVNFYGTNDFTLNQTDVTWIKTKDFPFNSSLLNLVSGQNLNFGYDIIEPTDAGIENNVQYITFENLFQKGGGGAWISYFGKPKFVTAISNTTKNQLGLSVFPNPSTDGLIKLEISYPIIGDLEMNVFNSLGQNVFSTPLMHRKDVTVHPFDFGNLINGNYHIILSNGDITNSIKFQINK
jgi:hypothetical protein